MDRSLWEPAVLVATGVLAVVLPWRVHLSAARSPQRSLDLPDALAALTVVAATAWAVVTVLGGHSPLHVLPAVVTALLVGVADHVRARSGLAPGDYRLPRWFVPAVLAVAAAGAIVGGVVDGAGSGATVAMAALVAASPAAAIIAVPAAFATGASRTRAAGARLSALATLDAAARVDTLVLEKDGTLTTGDLTVVSVDPVEPDHDRSLRWFAGALEKASDHRVGRAIAALSSRGQPADVELAPGHGIRGSVDRHPVRVGSPRWIGFKAPPTIWTTVAVEVDGRSLGSITVADDVRPDLARDVRRLTDLGVELVLVSGDTAERTAHVAGLANITTFHAPCGPDDTITIVHTLAAEGRHVAGVGIPASPDATLTITTNDSTTAGPTIIVDDCSPARVADALRITCGTASRVTRVRAVAATLGLVGVALAAAGLIGPLIATAVGAGVTAVVAVIATSR